MTIEETVRSTPPQNDRIMAALAHITIILPFMGVIAPIVIWATQKDKSEYIAFQALQAVVYQLTLILAWFIGMGCYMCSAFGIFLSIPILSALDTGQTSTIEPLVVLGPMVFPFVIFGGLLIGGLAFVGYGLVGTVLVLQGKDFRYAVIGQRLERYLTAK